MTLVHNAKRIISTLALPEIWGLRSQHIIYTVVRIVLLVVAVPALPIQAQGLPFYTAQYTAMGGQQFIMNIVGTDPSLGANTTIVPTVLVPLKFIFPNPGNPSLDGTNVAPSTQNSPIFLTADYMAGGTDLGVTQFGDALQRAQFWNLPGFSQVGDHVLLGTPSVTPALTINVPAGKGNAYPLSSGGTMGVVDDGFLNQVLNTLLPAYSANQLLIFLTDNVFLGAGGVLPNCCTAGFHKSEPGPIATAHTWIFAAYAEPGTFSGNAILDVEPLSREVAE